MAGRRNDSVATLLAVVTETESLFMIRAATPSVRNREADLDHGAVIYDGGSVGARFRLSCDQRQGHQRHHGQTDDFIEISKEKGFHRHVSGAPDPFR